MVLIVVNMNRLPTTIEMCQSESLNGIGLLTSVGKRPAEYQADRVNAFQLSAMTEIESVRMDSTGTRIYFRGPPCRNVQRGLQ